TFYPGTKLGFSEYNFGGENHISGGIAEADILGAFGKNGVYLASFWPLHSDVTYVASAFKLYRNYDGTGKQFGNTAVAASTTDTATCTTYASLEDTSTARLHVIVLNKSYDTATPVNFTIAGTTNYTSARVFAFDAASATITERAAVTGITGNHFSYTLPALTAAHFVLETATTGAPAITTQPSNVAVVTAGSAIFSVTATGTPAPTYQWLKNGASIAGATGSSYTIASASVADAASYTVVVTNSAGSVTSNAALLNLIIAPSHAVITITIQ
ncbi:MAG TPA: immunoglobulin domain-containing protein, partial [Lacunisphaera sp.]